MALIFVYLFLIYAFALAKSENCDIVENWTRSYKELVISALKVTPFDTELKSCVDQYPILDTNNTAYQPVNGSKSEPCCHMISLQECLHEKMIQFNFSDLAAQRHSRIFTQLWSGNEFENCDSLLTKHCATCLIYLNKAVIISIASITSVVILGVPATLLAVKYGWRWFCFGQRPQVPTSVQSLINNVSEIAS